MNYRKCGSLLTLSLLLNALVLSETEDSARAPDSSPMINILNKILNLFYSRGKWDFLDIVRMFESILSGSSLLRHSRLHDNGTREDTGNQTQDWTQKVSLRSRTEQREQRDCLTDIYRLFENVTENPWALQLRRYSQRVTLLGLRVRCYSQRVTLLGLRVRCYSQRVTLLGLRVRCYSQRVTLLGLRVRCYSQRVTLLGLRVRCYSQRVTLLGLRVRCYSQRVTLLGLRVRCYSQRVTLLGLRVRCYSQRVTLLGLRVRRYSQRVI
ncbi:hypothetical protein BgiBS90_032193 [Biomphalaria glabrata]|nr:hypothetical protein BgiBS90_032193 [Biomphalaria glabrata]